MDSYICLHIYAYKSYAIKYESKKNILNYYICRFYEGREWERVGKRNGEIKIEKRVPPQ
jgi:hypothetical protein